jgi:pimeloyl-ACP methyl ester carboxylesterase
MKRMVWFTLIVAGVAATAAGAGPFRSRGQAPQPGSVEYRTYCTSWTAAGGEVQKQDPRPLVWVLDGAGDLKGCSHALAWADKLAGDPVEIAVFPWSHGYRRLYADQTDFDHARAQGQLLARAILERKAREPGRRVVVVGHSAGCAVALAAGDALPIDAVDRFLLLAPSVSTGYDIRPTLWSAKEGLDVFCSKKDWVALGFVVRVVGTTDGLGTAAAGRWGFQPKGWKALDAKEAARLRQHFWCEEWSWTGQTGGHHGMHAPDFVLAYLMPIMTGK